MIAKGENMKKNIKAMLAMLLCLTIILGAFVMTGCQKDNGGSSDENDGESEQKHDDTISIVVMRNDVAKGARISSRDLEMKEYGREDLPESYITARTDAIGMYAKDAISAGTVLDSSMISTSLGESESNNNNISADDARDKGFIVITDYVEVNSGRDVSADIQAVIDENPRRTIYFPDGEYLLANPIATSGNPENAVALHLSNFAILKAMEGWDHTEAMVRLGGAEAYNNIHIPGSNYYLEGGCIDGSMVATGVSIDSGRETSIRNVSIKRTQIGIHIKSGANSGSSDADIDTVNIVGNAMPDSIGVLIDGYDNTLTNMRIAAVQTGVKLVGAGNFLRNIHPLYIYAGELQSKDPEHYDGVEHIDYSQSIAFWELSNNNWYDICYSDQFAVGFRIANGSTSLFNSCFCLWYSSNGNKEIGFLCDGAFNAMIVNSRVSFRSGISDSAFLKVGAAGGNGVIQYPIFSEGLSNDKAYRDYLVGKVR